MSTHESLQPHKPTATSALPVANVVSIVREWVDLHARHLPHFAGAYLWGGITALPLDALFPLYRDVDVVVVLDTDVADDTHEVFYRGLMMEIITQKLDAHRDPGSVLADPSRGPNLAATQILADPTGTLEPLQRAVAAEYKRRKWIQLRCEAEKASADEQLAAMRHVANPTLNQAALWPVWLLLNALSGLLAVALLKRPTTRRTLSLLGEMLAHQGRSDLHELALIVWGSSHMSRAEVQALLDQSVVAFDRSVEVYRTPTSFGFTIQRHLRPYLVEATQEMIDEGQHREATFWIMTLVTESYLVLQNDAPDTEKPGFAAQLQAMLAALGYTSSEAWAERIIHAEQLIEQIYPIADSLIALHPE